MRSSTIILILILLGISAVSGQFRVDKRSLDAAVKTLKEQTSAPLKIPTYFPFPAGSSAKEKRRPLYASGVTAGPETFGLNFCFSRETCHSAYFYAEISAEKITSETEAPSFDKKLTLAKGIAGYFAKSSC